MAGAVGIVFGLCVLSFTAGAALMYVVVRRREEPEAEAPQPIPQPVAQDWVEPSDEQLELRWHNPEYDSKPIHRNPVLGMPPLLDERPEPDAEPDPEPEPEPEPETVLSEPEPEPERKPEAVALPAQPEAPRAEQPVVVDEFRRRYLRTFEAARRRSSGHSS